MPLDVSGPEAINHGTWMSDEKSVFLDSTIAVGYKTRMTKTGETVIRSWIWVIQRSRIEFCIFPWSHVHQSS